MPGWQSFRIWLMAFLLFGCWALPLNAQVYTWKDDQGQTHFSDKKPGQRPHTSVSPTATSIMPMGSNISRGKAITRLNTAKPRPDQGRKRSRSDKALAKKARNQQKQAKKCVSYRAKIARLDQQLRAGYKTTKGNRLRSQRRNVSQKLSRECLLN